jgi:hypothetical protein
MRRAGSLARVPALPRLAAGTAAALAGGLVVSVAALSAGGGEPAARAGTAASAALLPDLRQELPARVAIERVRTGPGTVRERLGFRSAVDNVGDGPLELEGRRSSLAERDLRVEQRIHHADGSVTRVAGAGRLRYTESPDHEHWHLLGFDRYELRDGSGRRVVADRKTGFCLGDRYVSALAARLPAAPPRGRYTTDCGGGERDRLTLREGISVGYGDDYDPQLEGQFLDVTEVPDGRYVLVHRVDADRRLRPAHDAQRRRVGARAARAGRRRAAHRQGARELPRPRPLRALRLGAARRTIHGPTVSPGA